ncbi:MAG TPA: FG-GAP-like repeat-containing protein [Terriglobales bacterium]|nr:FG-GAP-like repeat-containing protein [Terriglobales bacterium]
MLVGLGIGLFAIQSKPSASAAAQANRLNNLGVGYMNQQAFKKALGYFQQARAADPSLSAAKVNEGIALLNLQQTEPARQTLLEVVKANPRDARAWYNLGLLYRGDNQPKEALDAFQHAAELEPKDADSHYFLGTVHMQMQQFPQAIEEFQKTLQLDAYHASAEFGLARAYQQSGNMAEARVRLAKFQQITKSKLGAAMSVAYGDQGPLSLAESSSATVEEVPAAIPVRFVDVTKEAGLANSAVGAEPKTFAERVGPGACLLDHDNDGKIDIFVASGGKQGGVALYHNLGEGKFADVTEAMGLDPKATAISCAAGDYDNDGFTDLAIGFNGRVALYHNEKGAKFTEVTQAAGIHTDGLPMGMTFIDYDHDGDLDLYITRGPQAARGINVHALEQAARQQNNFMWRNNGNGTFTDVSVATGLEGVVLGGSEGNGPYYGAVGSDFNNDRAIDLVVSGEVRPTIFVNPRQGKFHRVEPWTSLLPTGGIAVFDFNKDGWMDLAFTHWQTPALTLWRNVKGHSVEQVPLPPVNWERGFGVAALDYDNDGWIDLAAVGVTKDGRGEVRLLRNEGPKGFRDVSAQVGLDKVQLHEPRALVTGDFWGDGSADLLITQYGGPLVLLRNEGGNRNRWLRIAMKGLNDNKSAIGTKVEVFAGALHQKFEVQGGSGYLGQNSPEIIAGLGAETSADVVRMTWPTGVVQDEVQIAANQQKNILEIDRRGSSCPALFVWNGSRYDFVADMIGAGVVGHWVGPGERNIPRPTEYVKVDGERVRLRDGKLSFRFMEPMEEVVYLDQARLLAIDHPAGTQVYPNERFLSNPPYPAFKVIASRHAQPPAGAWDGHGRNVLPELLAQDHHYVTGFKLLPFMGFAEPHTLELDLGKSYRGGPLRLLATGYIDYFSANGMYAAHQSGIRPVAPYVEALSPSGRWVRVLDDMGFPAGLPRTMVADLSRRLPVGTRRIRITTNLQIYWDTMLFDRTDDSSVPMRITPVPLVGAKLDYHGYPRQVAQSLPGDIKFVYDDVSPTGPYAHEAGNYTRYGDVLPLLAQADDRFAVFGSGEEVALDFDASRLPALPAGWKRDYFFMANGYEKDMDFYAADANTVVPLPFHAMGVYPYGAGKAYPLDDAHLKYLLQYNTRQLSGEEPKSYQFQFSKP